MRSTTSALDETAIPATNGDAERAPGGTGSARERHVSTYAELTRTIKAAGLLKRRYGYYWTLIGATVAAFVGIWVGFFLLGNSWYQLLLAAGLAVVLAQFGFIGHEGAHRQIFDSHRWNEWTARVISGLFTGLSYGWWMHKHNRHHANPNKIDADPDVAPGALAFTPPAVEQRTSLGKRLARHQGSFFFPLLLLEGLALHAASIQTIIQRKTLKHRWWEAVFITLRLGGYVAILLIFLPPGKAAAFLGIQLGLFGVLLGGAFAPNHKGMPIVPATMKIDFLQRQVLMSRNITGGPVTDLAMGGLNYQVEHHLFPNMPRPNLRRAQPIVREFCDRHGISYTETTLVESYRIVVDYLNNVGLRARDPFQCPLTAQYRA